jgi:hypothetical protein
MPFYFIVANKINASYFVPAGVCFSTFSTFSSNLPMND